ncbi:hypothetical protein C8Q74DRAFT_259585 [Fomes fomentarius]|nr:hypothetical protein C8Q74DRAFT_259585 [Fomes fomentarius]
MQLYTPRTNSICAISPQDPVHRLVDQSETPRLAQTDRPRYGRRAAPLTSSATPLAVHLPVLSAGQRSAIRDHSLPLAALIDPDHSTRPISRLALAFTVVIPLYVTRPQPGYERSTTPRISATNRIVSKLHSPGGISVAQAQKQLTSILAAPLAPVMRQHSTFKASSTVVRRDPCDCHFKIQ